jgi:hypothetical protein
MALITTLERREKARNTIQDSVRATYCTFGKNGQKFFQIDTYGTNERENLDVPSQIIQFDKAFAKKLVSILINELW